MITILGPTATGKTALAVQLASLLNGEIVSADSRQVYIGMDIGTGKDLQEYQVNTGSIPYHLIDIRPAGYEYNVYEYQEDFYRVYDGIVERNKTPILCGGTGMYIDAILKGYKLVKVPVDPELRLTLEKVEHTALVAQLKGMKVQHNSTDISTKKRTIRAIEIALHTEKHGTIKAEYPSIPNVIIGLHAERNVIREKITRRLKQRFKEGLIEEVEGLNREGVDFEKLKFYGLEYKFIAQYLEGELDRKQMFEKLNIAIHQFSKRQMTWFRRMEKQGFTIHWIDAEQEMDVKLAQAQEIYRTALPA